MQVGFSDEQELLRRAAREVLERECPMARVRSAMDDASDTCADLLATAAKLGWSGLTLPTHYGGAGLGVVELAILLEEMGRVLLPAPYLAGALAGCAIELAGDAAQQQRWLPQLAGGELRATVALQGGVSGAATDGVALPARRDGDDLVVSGVLPFVVDGDRAELLLVPVQEGEAAPVLAALEPQAPGVRVDAVAFVDATRRVAELELREARVGPPEMLREGGFPLLGRLHDLARVALSAEMCGGAARVLELCVGFARTREQFGRPIGSFQAIQHKCADMLVAVEGARSATYAAAWALDAGAEDGHLAACMAKAWCADAYRGVAGEGIQIHGGLGFTWEQDLHLYFKRACASEALLGGSSLHREEIARLLLDP